MYWYDRAIDALDNELELGIISKKEYRDAVRELDAELREAADEAAESAREAYYY